MGTNSQIKSLKTGESANWKFGIVTREVYRVSEDIFEINDLSCGWVTALVNKETMQRLLKGEISLLSVDFS